jgi:hypothetical protein
VCCFVGLCKMIRILSLFIHSIGLCRWDDSLPFAGASSIPLCYIPFLSTLFHPLVFNPPSLHLPSYCLVCQIHASVYFKKFPHLIFFKLHLLKISEANYITFLYSHPALRYIFPSILPTF